MSRGYRTLVWLLYVGVTCSAMLLITLPVVGLLRRSIAGRAWERISSEPVLEALALSLVTTLVSLIIIVLIGTPTAYALARGKFAGRRFLNLVIELPVVLPPAVAGLALLVTFGRRGLVNEVGQELGLGLVLDIGFSEIAVIFAQVFVAAPFYIRAAQSGFASIDRAIEEAAQVDGASSLESFFYVSLPLSMRSMISGALLSWARALGEFGATIIFAGSLAGKTRTMPLLIYSQLDTDIDSAVWTALILVAMAVVAAAATRFVGRGNQY